MILYIDPGTGSMLFAILIGIAGAAQYALRTWWVKMRFLLSGGRASEGESSKIPLVFFSDDKRYWTVFEPLCRELNKRGIDLTYCTASDDDPALSNTYKHVHAEFIGAGNKGFAKLNLLNASILVSTTPGLDVYQWKRSRDVDFYVHMLHAPSEIISYRSFGIDYYDALLLSGEYQEIDLRKMEKLRNLPAKEVRFIGIPYMDEMAKRLAASANNQREAERTVLLAPSWGPSSLLNTYGSRLIDLLLETGYHLIVRPHPQSFTSEKAMIERLMKQHPNSDQLEWNRDVDNFDVLNRSDIMISDFSGVIFDFALVYNKPVIYAEAAYTNDPYDSWWLNQNTWTQDILPAIGQQLSPSNIGEIKKVIDECLTDERFAEGRNRARAETWMYPGEGAVRAADYLEEKLSLHSALNEKESA